MENLSYFETMAQVSGIIVGFANLANVINRPNVQTQDSQLNKIRISVSTEGGLCVIIACLMPLLFQSGGIPLQILCKRLSGILFFFIFLYMVYNMRRNRKLTGAHFPHNVSRFIIMFGFGISLLSGLNALELFGVDNVVLFFGLTIFAAFLGQIFMFVRLFNSMLSNQGGDQHPA